MTLSKIAIALLGSMPQTFATLASKYGVYSSSSTPANLPWNTYNYCNSPHVNAAHYSLPAQSKAHLVYVNMIMRHHKRTPDNLYPNENELNPPTGWDCTDFVQIISAGGARELNRETFIPPSHPFARTIWNGTCDEGQLTGQGLEDTIKHGQDFWAVYHRKLGFLRSVSEDEILVRTSSEIRTQHVASGILFGMDPQSAQRAFPIHIHPASIDSIPPSYPCPKADAIRAAYQAVPAWSDHIHANQNLQDRLNSILGTAGLEAWSFWYDHFFDTFTSRTCAGHPLPCNSTGSCVSEDDARRVFSIGDFEYNYVWNAAENSTTYVQLTFGVFFAELLQNLRNLESGEETHKLRLYVGHDGTMIRLASGLGLGKNQPLRWPGLGSEIIIEVWQTSQDLRFIRVMHEGTPVLGLQWVLLSEFIALLEGMIPSDLFEACMSA